MPDLLTERVLSFAQGVNDATAPSEYQPAESRKLVNYRPALQGNSLRRRGVTWSPNDDSAFGGISYPPLGGVEWELTSGARQIVIIARDSGAGQSFWYSNDQGRTWNSIANALNMPPNDNYRASFATIESGGTNYLCIAMGAVLSYKWDGTTLTAIANIPSGVLYLESFNNRLVAAGHSGTRVVASKVGDPDTWAAPDGWDIDAATSDGDNFITGLFQLGPILMVFKRESVGYIEGFGFQTLQVQTGARGISRSVGCIGSHSIAPLGDYGVMWLSERGFEAYTLNSGIIQLVSRPMQNFVDAIQKYAIVAEGFAVPQGIWLPQEREYWCAVPVGLYTIKDGSGANPSMLPNNYVYCYRPGSATEPPAQYAFTWSDAASSFRGDTGYSVRVSSDTDTYPGAICFEQSRSGSQMIVAEDGLLRITEGEEFGIDITISGYGLDGNKGFALSSNGTYEESGVFHGSLIPLVLFTADHDGQLSQPCMLTPDGWFHYTDDQLTTNPEGYSELAPSIRDTRDIEALAGLRPMLFGDQFTKKQVHRVRVQSSQDATTNVEVQVYADGEPFPVQIIAQESTSRGRAVEGRVRARGKGQVVDVEIFTAGQNNDSFDLVGVEVDARYLKKAR